MGSKMPTFRLSCSRMPASSMRTEARPPPPPALRKTGICITLGLSNQGVWSDSMSLCDLPSPTPQNLLGTRRVKHVHLFGRAWCSKASALAVSKGYHSVGSRSAPVR